MKNQFDGPITIPSRERSHIPPNVNGIKTTIDSKVKAGMGYRTVQQFPGLVIAFI